MTVYTGFQSGTYQAWALNLQQGSLGAPGTARGMQVSANNPAGMSVIVGLDGVQNDGVCWLPNGAWTRIDAAVTLTVPSNTGGSTRTDAVVAIVDPTNSTTSGIFYQSGWTNGWKGLNTNELVLAQVNVPNNAISIATNNIVPSPLVASTGHAPGNYPDAIVGSEQVDGGSQPGIFTAIEVEVTTSATNGQTSYTIPLTNQQRLVPQGRIGGALEVGYFAGPNGWYWPKVRGSVSGLLPVASVDPIGGNITTATGAQAGEAVFVSYKYYDFSRDARVRAGVMFIEKNSPYLVYQGEVVDDLQLGLQQPLWDGPSGAWLLLNPGESYWYIDYSERVDFALLGGPGTTANSLQFYQNGTLGVSATPSAAGVPAGQTYRMYWQHINPTNGFTPNVYQVKLISGFLACPGVRNYVNSNQGVFVSGGVVNIQGQPVLLQSTSFQLPVPSAGNHDTYVVYTDRYGNISSSGGNLSGPMDRILGRVPIAGALQYGGDIPQAGSTSSSFGTWTLPKSYMGWPVNLVMTGYTTASVGGALPVTGWSFKQDVGSSFGAYPVTNSVGDTLLVSAVCTGMDLLVNTGGVTTGLWVTVDNLGSGYNVYSSTLSAHNVRMTLFSSQPFGTHTVRVVAISSAMNTGLEALDVRVPATPAPPAGTLPLAQVEVFGTSCLVRPSLLRGGKVSDFGNTSSYLMDGFRPTAEPAVWLSNNTSGNYQLVVPQYGTGGFVVHYQAGPDKGIISLTNFSIDCYSSGLVTDTTALVFTGGSVGTVSLSCGGFKNPSASGWGILINAIDFFPWYTHVTDLRHFGLGQGYASELRGSALTSHQGGRFDDGGHGVRTDQLRDRSITSRKMVPTWKTAVTVTPFSGFPGIDPNLSASVTVEVPSVLWCQANLTPIVGANSGFNASFVVDGVTQSSIFSSTTNHAASASYIPAGLTGFFPVPAGTHTVQVFGNNGNFGAQPYYDSGSNRTLAIVAFAL